MALASGPPTGSRGQPVAAAYAVVSQGHATAWVDGVVLHATGVSLTLHVERPVTGPGPAEEVAVTAWADGEPARASFHAVFGVTGATVSATSAVRIGFDAPTLLAVRTGRCTDSGWEQELWFAPRPVGALRLAIDWPTQGLHVDDIELPLP